MLVPEVLNCADAVTVCEEDSDPAEDILNSMLARLDIDVLAEQMGIAVSPGTKQLAQEGQILGEPEPPGQLEPIGQTIGFRESKGQYEPAGQMTGVPDIQ